MRSLLISFIFKLHTENGWGQTCYSAISDSANRTDVNTYTPVPEAVWSTIEKRYAGAGSVSGAGLEVNFE